MTPNNRAVFLYHYFSGEAKTAFIQHCSYSIVFKDSSIVNIGTLFMYCTYTTIV